MKEIAQNFESFKMILKQKLGKGSEDLSTESFGAWVNILLLLIQLSRLKTIPIHRVEQLWDILS